MTVNKNIDEIELEYVKNIIEFFCREYSKRIPVDNDLNSEFISRISKQIENRLLNTNLIVDYNVQVNISPISEKRNNKIENLLEDKNLIPDDNITVLYTRYKGSPIYEYKYTF